MSTSFARYDENFTISIALKDVNDQHQELTKSIAKWFDSEGGFVEDLFVKDVKELLAAAEKSQ